MVQVMSANQPSGFIRSACEEDIPQILALVNEHTDTILARTENEVRALLPTYWVAEENGCVVGCCCLEVYSQKIAEIRSLIVREDCQHKGYGTTLVNRALEESVNRGIREVLAVTSVVPFFERLNFGPCLNEKYALFWRGSSGK